ncbi:MAG TPA: NTF2-like N-terminal transpeptidase domain-containing protein, partial [Actinoplanes sp.]|nr:NTF2-like N-terminal transpeptidase domain-containing protein [Actinoplanes sp.]
MPTLRPGRSRTAAVTAAVVLLAGAVTGCSSSDGPRETLEAFLAGWQAGNLDQVGFIAPDGATFPAQQALTAIKGLSGQLAGTPPTVQAADADPRTAGDIATMGITVRWALPGAAAWSYPSEVRLAERGGGWRVIWEPAIV